MTTMQTIEHSPRTHWNRGKGRTERRVFRDGHWVRPDAEIIATRHLVFGKVQSGADSRAFMGEALERARIALGV